MSFPSEASNIQTDADIRGLERKAFVYFSTGCSGWMQQNSWERNSEGILDINVFDRSLSHAAILFHSTELLVFILCGHCSFIYHNSNRKTHTEQ